MSNNQQISISESIKLKLDSSLWIKETISSLLKRDIIDAENDVLTLVEVQKVRLQSAAHGNSEYIALIERIRADRSVSYWLMSALNVLDNCKPDFALDEAAALYHLFTHSDITKTFILH